MRVSKRPGFAHSSELLSVGSCVSGWCGVVSPMPQLLCVSIGLRHLSGNSCGRNSSVENGAGWGQLCSAVVVCKQHSHVCRCWGLVGLCRGGTGPPRVGTAFQVCRGTERDRKLVDDGAACAVLRAMLSFESEKGR